MPGGDRVNLLPNYRFRCVHACEGKRENLAHVVRVETAFLGR